jgi:hypothetical protein
LKKTNKRCQIFSVQVWEHEFNSAKYMNPDV